LEFDWDNGNIEHIARHNVSPSEAEQVLLIDPIELESVSHPMDGIRIRYIGRTAKDRILIVLMTWRGDLARIISGWDAPRADKQIYLRATVNHYD